MFHRNTITASFAASVLLVILSLIPSAAYADSALDFVLVNDTGYTIDKVFVSPAKIEEWGEDVMGPDDQVPDGKSVKIHFTRAHEEDNNRDLNNVFPDMEA